MASKYQQTKETTNLSILEDLVDEMLKSSPQEKMIREMMEQMDVEYSEDPLQRMSSVLQVLDLS